MAGEKNGKVSILVVIILAVITWVIPTAMLCGCGRKAPPEPPSGNRPPKVEDLGYSLSNNTIKLSWTIPKSDDKAKSRPAGFLIYRSKLPPIDSDCPNCPKRFKQVGEVPVRDAGAGRLDQPSVVFAQTIEPGYFYIYKVRAYDVNGAVGKDSDQIEFTF